MVRECRLQFLACVVPCLAFHNIRLAYFIGMSISVFYIECELATLAMANGGKPYILFSTFHQFYFFYSLLSCHGLHYLLKCIKLYTDSYYLQLNSSLIKSTGTCIPAHFRHATLSAPAPINGADADNSDNLISVPIIGVPILSAHL